MAGFYTSRRWQALRLFVLRRDRYRCVQCGARVVAPGAARVDHIVRIADDPRRALDPTNCRTLCATCDNRSHAEKALHLPYRVERMVHGNDASGIPRDANHPWNRGLP